MLLEPVFEPASGEALEFGELDIHSLRSEPARRSNVRKSFSNTRPVVYKGRKLRS